MITDSGIELLAAAVIKEAFRDLNSKDRHLRYTAHAFFQEGWYEAWSKKDLSRYYRMYCEEREIDMVKSGERPKDFTLRDYMQDFPKVTQQQLADKLGVSKPAVAQNLRNLSEDMQIKYWKAVREIKEGKLKCMKMQKRRERS